MAFRSARRTSTPQVIAHRGASGHRPEHTLAGYELAYRLGADSVELDVVATKDGVLVCRHDLDLSRTTDIAERPELAHLGRTVEVDGTSRTGWFVHDLTLAEVKQLRSRERWARKRPGNTAYDGRYEIPTLAEVLDLRDREAARLGSPLDVHVELKSPELQRGHGLWQPELVGDLIRRDVSWMSFHSGALEDLAAPRSYRLFDAEPSGKELSRVADFVVGVGVRRKAVLPRDIAGRVGTPSKLVGKANKRGLEVLVWTHRAENQHLPSNLRIGSAPHGHGDAAGEAALLFDAGIDGLITDYPEIAVLGRSRVHRPLARAVGR